jgi:hypothetical protein
MSLSHSQKQQENIVMTSSNIQQETQQKDTIAHIETFT